MRIILVTLYSVMIFITGFAQDSTRLENHLKFKGVPIDGTLNEFVDKMKNKGFILVNIEDGIAKLKGDFAGYKDCEIWIPTLKDKDLVYKVVVSFPDEYEWSSLSSEYFTIKELLTEKYGKPAEIVEKFNSSNKPEDDESKMQEVITGNCKYYTSYNLKNGIIQLSIEDGFLFYANVILIYYDKKNSEIIRQKALDDL